MMGLKKELKRNRRGLRRESKKGIEKGARALISSYQETGLSYDDTLKKLMEKLELDSPTLDQVYEFWIQIPV